MEAEKSQDLQSTSWKPRTPNVQFQFKSERLKTRRANGVISSMKAMKTQEELMFQFESQGQQRPMPQLKALRKKEFSLTHERVNLFVLFRPSAD